jgi:hypothetical protein
MTFDGWGFGNLPPDFLRDFNNLTADVRELQRRKLPDPEESDSITTPPDVTFSHPGVLANDEESPPWYPFENMTFSYIRVSTLINVGADTTVAIVVDGSVFDTYTIPSGSKTMATTISCPAESTQPVTMRVIDEGSPAADLTAQLWAG